MIYYHIYREQLIIEVKLWSIHEWMDIELTEQYIILAESNTQKCNVYYGQYVWKQVH